MSVPAKGEGNIHSGLITDYFEFENAIKGFWENKDAERLSEITET